MVAVPEYLFLVLLVFLTGLGFGASINSGRPIAAYMPSAMVTLLILVNSSLAEGAEFSDNFVTRIVFIAMAAIYVVFALKMLDAFWPKRTESRAEA